jgi:hypothetical protein
VVAMVAPTETEGSWRRFSIAVVVPTDVLPGLVVDTTCAVNICCGDSTE